MLNFDDFDQIDSNCNSMLENDITIFPVIKNHVYKSMFHLEKTHLKDAISIYE